MTVAVAALSVACAILIVLLLGQLGGGDVERRLASFWAWWQLGLNQPSRDLTIALGTLIGGGVTLVIAVWRARIADRQARAQLLQARASLRTALVARRNAEVALKQASVAEKQVEIATRQAEIASETANRSYQKELSERFHSATEKLTSEQKAVRIAGLRELDRLRLASHEYHWPTVTALVDYIRDSATIGGSRDEADPDSPVNGSMVSSDIQLCLDLIGTRKTELDPPDAIIDLSNTWLKGARFINGEWSKSRFRAAILDDSEFGNTNLRRADLSEARIRRARFMTGSMQGANLQQSRLASTFFGGADLAETNLRAAKANSVQFSSCILVGAVFRHAELNHAGFEKCALEHAQMNAYLGAAEFKECSLEHTNFLSAKLSGTIFVNCTKGHRDWFRTAETDDATRLPDFESSTQV